MVMNNTRLSQDIYPEGQVEITSTTELYVVISFLAFLSVMGTTGNALVLYVFSKKKDKLVSTLFILVLALVDFTTCLFVIPMTIVIEYKKFQINYDILCKLYQFLITSNIPFSALIMVAIAVDRYFSICHPFFHGLNIQRAKFATVGLGLFSFGLGVIVALMFGVYHKKLPAGEMNVTNSVNNSTENVFTRVVLHNVNTTTYTGDYKIVYNYNEKVNSYHTTMIPDDKDFATAAASHINYSDYVTANGFVYTGKCDPNYKIISQSFGRHYHRFYYSLFVLCLLIVIVLYTLIYVSVLKRRSRRQKQKSKALPLLMQKEAVTHSTPDTLLTVVNGDSSLSSDSRNPPNVSPSSPLTTLDVSRQPMLLGGSGLVGRNAQKLYKKNSLKKAHKHKCSKRENMRMVNIKTAVMLFVVTVVFVVTFLPAFLMVLGAVPYSMMVFYLYFANNVANPIIYSFMNKNFREDLRKLFCRKK